MPTASIVTFQMAAKNLKCLLEEHWLLAAKLPSLCRTCSVRFGLPSRDDVMLVQKSANVIHFRPTKLTLSFRNLQHLENVQNLQPWRHSWLQRAPSAIHLPPPP